MYELMGRMHAWLAQEQGQGTVEYVGLILLLGGIIAVVVAAAGGSRHGDRRDDGQEAQGRDRRNGWARIETEALPEGRARLAAWSLRSPRPRVCAAL